MTINNNKILTIEEIKHWLNDNNLPDCRKVVFYRNVYNSILYHTTFLNDVKNVSMLSRLYCIMNDIREVPLCKYCHENKVTRVDSLEDNVTDLPYSRIAFNDYCGFSCMAKDKSEARKQTVQERYGVDNVFEAKEIKEKIKETYLERYGVDHYFKSDESKERYTAAMRERYGVDHYSQTEDFKSKMRDMDVYTKHLPKEVIEILNDKEKLEALYEEYKTLGAIANHLGCAVSYVGKIFRRLDIDYEKGQTHIHESKPELLVKSWLDELGVEYIRNDRDQIKPQEIDFYIPNKRLAIEVNGVYWHSDVYKDKKYHQEKALKLKENGIYVLTLWEDQLVNEPEKLKSKLKYSLGLSDKIGARKCVIEMLTPTEAKTFLNTHHTQGFKRSTYHIGLKYNDEIVACLSMLQYKGTKNFELERYCTSINVMGGFSKLLKFFITRYSPETINTFASLEYGKWGDMYIKNGFVCEGLSQPNYFYSKGLIRYSRQQFMKHMLKSKLEIYDEEKTEKENMKENGFLLCYDSGSYKFKWSAK